MPSWRSTKFTALRVRCRDTLCSLRIDNKIHASTKFQNDKPERCPAATMSPFGVSQLASVFGDTWA